MGLKLFILRYDSAHIPLYSYCGIFKSREDINRIWVFSVGGYVNKKTFATYMEIFDTEASKWFYRDRNWWLPA